MERTLISINFPNLLTIGIVAGFFWVAAAAGYSLMQRAGFAGGG